MRFKLKNVTEVLSPVSDHSLYSIHVSHIVVNIISEIRRQREIMGKCFSDMENGF